jgi:hypothetical protein
MRLSSPGSSKNSITIIAKNPERVKNPTKPKISTVWLTTESYRQNNLWRINIQKLEKIMQTHVLIVSFLALSLNPAVARGDVLDVAAAACDGNPDCSHGDRDQNGQMRFRIMLEGMPVSLQCSLDGECVKILPRGKSARVSGATLLLTAK